MQSVKNRYLWGRWVTILLPIVFSVAFAVNTVLGYYGIEAVWMDDVFGLSWGSVLMMYVMHRMFGLCRRHLMMILYLTFTLTFTLADSLVGIPVSDDGTIVVMLTAFFLFASAYLLSLVCK